MDEPINAAARLKNMRNPVLQQARSLKKRRVRDETHLFRIEGHREIDRALEAGVDVRCVIYCDTLPRFTRSEETLKRLKAQLDASTYATSSSVFSNLSQWQNPDGLLVIAEQPSIALADFKVDTNGVFLVIDGVEKPGNLGSMFRTADATGCSGILISDPVVDLFNPNVIRASLGTVFTMPSALASSTRVAEWLRKKDLRIVSCSPRATRSYLEVSLGANCAIVIGSEKDGLNESWVENSNTIVRLPNVGYADSLNAAMAANAMLFEAYRQRQDPAQSK